MPSVNLERSRVAARERWLDDIEDKRGFLIKLEKLKSGEIMRQIERKQLGQTRRQNIATQGGIESTKLDVAGRKDVASMLGERELRKLTFEHGSPQEFAKARGAAYSLAEREVAAEELRAGTRAAAEYRLGESEQYYRGANKKAPASVLPKESSTTEEDIEDIQEALRRKKRLELRRQF